MMQKLLFLLTLLLSSTFVIAQSEVIDLFIWAGQSNAQGWTGRGTEYPADIEGLDEQIRLNYVFINSTSSDGWITMQAQNGRYPEGHFGPEVTFSRAIKNAGYNPAIFKYTKGGTSLNTQWKTAGKGGFYDNMVSDLKSSIDELENQGHTVNIRGFIWIQGENDSNNIQDSDLYYSNLNNIINDLRTRVTGNNTLPIALGVDEQHPGIVSNPTVLEAHQNIAAGDNAITFTSMLDLPKSDLTHLTPAGLELHGQRVADAMLCLLNSSSSACVNQNSNCSQNIAQGKIATQSSNYANNNNKYGAVNAIDGNNNGNHAAGFMTHTKVEQNPWWEIDLGTIQNLESIKLWNRTDCCANRLSNFHVLVSNAPFNSKALNTTINQSNVEDFHFMGTAGRETNIDLNTTGRYLRIQF